MSKDRADGRTQRGQFAPKTSGNPNGRRRRTDADPPASTATQPAVTDPRFDVGTLLGRPEMLSPRAQMMSSSPKRVARKDDWYNALTGQGIAGRDKRMSGDFAPIALSFDRLRDIWLSDGMAKNAVEMLTKEARRPGYDITIAEEGESDGDGDDLSQDIKDRLKDLGADTHLQTIGNYSRAYGGGAILIGANDKQTDLTKELDLDAIVSLDHLTPYEARECIPLYAYGDPSKPKYGEPEIYQLTSRSVLPSRTGSYAGTIHIHESRLIVFDGVRVSRYQATAARMGWGESMLSRIWSVIRDFNTAYASAGILLSEFGQMVMKMQGLWAALAQDDGKLYEDRLTAMAAGASATNTMVIDAEDSIERQQTPVNGLSDLMGKFDVRLAAACEMPLTLLFGTSPGGMNATGESDIRFFYDRVDEYRNSRLEPALRKLIQILFRTIGNKREPAKWSLRFKPLWQESAKEQAAAMLTQAQADNTWIQAQVLSPEEVADAHWGQGEYNPHLSLDHEARDAQAEATAGEPTAEDLVAMGRDPTAPVAEPPNGAQLSSMMEIVKAAVTGEIPRESAQALLQVAIPSLSPAQAVALLGPAGFKPVVPEAPARAGAPQAAAPANDEARADGEDKPNRSKKDLLRKLAPSGKCAACGQSGHKLEVDHVNGRNWSPRELSKTQRAARYWDEHDRGVKLRALCRSCNGSDGAKNKQVHDAEDVDEIDRRLDAIDAYLDASERGDDWSEELHPRGADGKFGAGGGEAFKNTKLSTEDLYKPGGHWTPERTQLHNTYTAGVQAGVPRSVQPTVCMTGGGPASGKSVALLSNPSTGIPDKTQAVHADPDGAKETIPEYAANKHSGDLTVAARVHEESSHMSQLAVKDSLKAGHDVVYDSTGDGGIAKLSAKVAALRAAGAQRVVAHYATIDVDEAIRRSDKRAERSGRYVPHDYLRQVHRDVTGTVLGAIEKGVYDSLDLWDNSGKAPTHVASYTRDGGLQVKDEAAWEAFKKRGG